MTESHSRSRADLLVALAIAFLVPGCQSEPPLPEVPNGTVTIHLPDCDVAMPPVVDSNWRGREAFDAAGPALTCRILHILRDRMTAQPVKVDWAGPLDDLQPGDWGRIARVFFQRMPAVPPPPPGMIVNGDLAERSKGRLQLCADVPKRERLICVTISEQGTAPLFGAGVR
jgi:hypothetical protein